MLPQPCLHVICLKIQIEKWGHMLLFIHCFLQDKRRFSGVHKKTIPTFVMEHGQGYACS